VHTYFVAAGAPNRAAGVHFMSTGHSAAFEFGVHWRRQLPPGASDGIVAQNVSA
jgi:hypothetical protein